MHGTRSLQQLGGEVSTESTSAQAVRSEELAVSKETASLLSSCCVQGNGT